MKKTTIILAFAAILACSCNSMLELYPHNGVSPDAVTEDDVPQLRIGMYWKVQELPTRTTYILNDLLGANLTLKGSNSTLSLINSTLSPQSSVVEDGWTGCYKALYQVNNVYSIACNLPDGKSKDQILGECHYFRAWLHLLLVTHWGDAPLMKKNTVSDVARTSAELIWQFVEEEIALAEELLPEGSDYYYLTKNAATALMARIMLYRGNNSEAVRLAESLISNPRYKLDSFDNIFRASANSETIFAFKCGTSDGSGITLSTMFYSYNHPNKGSYIYQPAPDVMNSLFEDTDTRKGMTITTLDNLNFINKYPSGQTGSDPVIVSRLAEMYLISAEAQGPELGIGRLNDLRRARGLSDIFPGSKAAFDDALMLERRREFVCEGHRYYDLVRTGRAVSELGIQPYQQILPVPESELQNNSLLTQNENY